MDLFSKGRAKIDQLLNQTLALVQSRYAQSNQMFTVASVWGQIIFVLQNLTQLNLFFIEDSITELNMSTASRDSSIYGLAAQVGHNATRNGSAIGQVQIRWNFADATEVGGGAILIPNKSILNFVDSGNQFILNLSQDMVRFNLNGTSSINAQIIQGNLKSQSFGGTGTPLQTFNVFERYTGSIENFNTDVYVDGVLWSNYSSLWDIPFDAKGVLVKTSVGQGIDIIFGTTKNGHIPDKGSIIRVDYIESLGFGGNIDAQDPSKVNFEFTSDGTDIFGNTVSLNDYLKINCLVPPQMGSNSEAVQLTRILAPKTSRSYILANPDNYITFFEKYGTFSIIEAFNTSGGAYIDDQNIIYVLLVPDVTLKLASDQNYFNLKLSDFTLSDFQKTTILNVIETSGQKIVGTEVMLLDPKTSRYIVNVILTVFEGYDPDTIKSGIVDRFSQYFLSIRRRDIIPRSDLIALVEAIPGVDSVMIFFVSEKNENYQSTLSTLSANDPKRSILFGLNGFGDIVMEKDEVVIISGGWTDSNGLYYDVGADSSKLSSVNIEISSYTPVSYNTQVNALNKASIKA